MIELVKAGGWVMAPILMCSVLALAIILERAWSLRRSCVLPPALLADLRHWAEQGSLRIRQVEGEHAGSPLGRMLRAALVYRQYGREVVKESIEDTGRHIVFELERFLNTLGTIATISPLLGLLGTVSGMIEILGIVGQHGSGNFKLMASGMSEALVATASGIVVAIPTLVAYRYYRGRVDELVISLEKEAMLLVDLMQVQPARPNA